MTNDTRPSWIEAAQALAGLMEAENANLQAADYAAAAALLPLKRRVIESIERAQPAGPKAPLAAAAKRLDRLTLENRRLLAGAIGVQAQLLEMIAGAARTASASGYGRRGSATTAIAAYALSAKA